MRSPITLVPAVVLLFAAACTAHEPPATDAKATPIAKAEPKADPKPEPRPEPKPEPKPEPEPARLLQLTGSISSVSLVEDCPDSPPPTPAAEIAPAMPMPESGAAKRMAPGAAATPMRDQAKGDTAFGHWSPPCRQSTVQLTLAHDGDIAQRISIAQARLVDVSSGKSIATIATRGPTRWDDQASGYIVWDELLSAGPGIKASYKLAVPADLTPIRVVLELDVRFDGRTITLRSPEVQQEPPHVIVT